ncbi:MAG: hypothetical protein U5J95_09500 [Balneolaceae bacterium]|nr:hypothetical protein [Balneolaceae bacterium]
MTTMEFEVIKKIWDEQNQQQMYVVNEEALHRNIQSKKRKAIRLTNLNDFGLIGTGIITAMAYTFIAIINETPVIFDYLIVTSLICISGYVWYGRIQRQKTGMRFDRTILGDLDHTISNVDYEVKRSRSMVWWFLLPLAILVVLNMSTADEASIWEWLGIAACFVLSDLLIRWEYIYKQRPKLKRLKDLRTNLLEESE